MITSINKENLVFYLNKQLNNFFPDDVSYKKILKSIVPKALEKIEYNFKYIKLSHYWQNSSIYFNHLNADHYTLFLYYISNIAYKDYHNIQLASKLFYLNKTLHGFHCMYDTKLPDIFLVIHGSGIVLGKASYDNFLVVMQGVTVGSNPNLDSPTIGKNVILYPNSAILGKSIIADETCLSYGTVLMNTNTNNNSIIFGHSPNIIEKQQKIRKSKIYFNN